MRRFVLMLLLSVAGCSGGSHETSVVAHEHAARSAGVADMSVPPRLLSEVGVFEDLATLKPVAGLVPYVINVSFWSDGAEKRRWMGLPTGRRIGFAAEGEWRFPAGTVFVKSFELPADEAGATGARRLIETRVLVCDGAGEVSGASYKWREDGRDAEIVNEAVTAAVGAAGRTWYFPGRADCRVCHTRAAGGVLGVKTRQMNRAVGGSGENQLIEWERRGLFEPMRERLDPGRLAKLVPAGEVSVGVESRARSYLDANCANCHRPGGVAGIFDARFDTPLGRQNLIDGPVLIDLGIDRARVIAPRDVWRSIALARVETADLTRMPPLAHQRVDAEGARLLRAWIESLPGAEVLEPPVIEPRGGEFRGAVRVALRHRDAGATIRYTLDGSLPGKNSAVYEGPLEILGPVTLRVRAYRAGATRSVVVQETFVVND